MKKSVLQEKSFDFSLNLINLLQILPKNYIFQTLGKQLLRSGTSVGANIVEAQAGRTKRDFTNYYHIALKSGNETRYWLNLLLEKSQKKENQKKIKLLIQNVTELNKMLAASLLTLKGKREL